jgi:hypothetical protein
VAKKKAGKKVEATKARRDVRAVRLDLSPSDHDRLTACAERRGLSLSSYARMAVLEMIRRDEKEEGGRA